MNVSALDVIARTADFESLASPLELRGWEWDLLHAADGETTLAALAGRLDIDVESAIGFANEAVDRGLLGVATLSLRAYRVRAPQVAIAQPSPPPYATAAASASATTAPAPAPSQTDAEPEKAPGAISFSVNSFDWNEPQEPFAEPAGADVAEASPPPPLTHERPPATITAHVGGVHYDDRFGIEHPDGPFDTSRDHAAADAHVEPTPAPPTGGIAAAVAAVSAVALGAVVDAVLPHEREHEHAHDAAPETSHAATVADPFAAPAHVDDPFAASPHVSDPFAASSLVDDPFAVSSHVDDPFAAAQHDATPFDEFAHHAEPAVDIAHLEPEPEPEPLGVVEHHHAEPISANGVAAAEEPVEDSTPGSISFSFSANDPFEAHDDRAPEPEALPSLATASLPPVDDIVAKPTVASAPEPATIEHLESDAVPAGSTQSTYFEREAIDTDAARELEAKAKTWKESLSWREQQDLNEAMATGKEKQGVIGSLLRALGVR